MTAFELAIEEASTMLPLTALEERAMLKGWKRNKKRIREKLVLHNRRFAIKMALACRGWQYDLSDILSAAYMGLAVAATKFDPDKGVRFISYAVWYIRQSINADYQDNHRTVRLPKNVQDAYSDLPVEIRRNVENADVDAISELMGWTKEHAQNVLKVPVRDLQLDLMRDDWKSRHDIFASGDPGPEEILDKLEERQRIERSMSGLTDRERSIIRWYYGLDDGEECTLDVIGARLKPKITRERVRQIKETAKEKMRRTMERAEGE